MSCMSRRALRQGTDVNIVHDASDTHRQSLLQRPAFVRTHEAGAPWRGRQQMLWAAS
jgi:hypothetical protein